MYVKRCFASAALFLLFASAFSQNAADQQSVALNQSSGEKQSAPADNTSQVFSLESGYVRLDINGTQGTFCLYVVNPDSKKREAVFATRDASSTTFFALKIGRLVYRLNRSYGIRCRVSKTQTGAELIYTVDNAAEVSVLFDIFSSAGPTAGLPADMIKITVTTKNTGTSAKNFSMRGIFDTVLGELAASTFSTAGIRRINSEMQFSSMKNERWILSSNEKASAQFLLYGRGITEPESVTLANKDIISSSDWEVAYVPGRAFNSILSYNNSAVNILWGKSLLDPGAAMTESFYIAVAPADKTLHGEDYLGEIATAVPVVSAPAVPAAPVESAPPPVTVPAPVVTAVPAEQPKESVEFDVSKIKKDQLDPEYVRGLIKQINEMEADGSSLNKEKIRQLNAELDAILLILRQKK